MTSVCSDRAKSATAGRAPAPASAIELRRRLDRLAPFGLVALVTWLVASNSVLSARRPLWNDELFTYYFNQLPDLGSLWRELGRGAEQTPPGFYVLTRTSTAIFGDTAFALRAPAIGGFVLACCCLYAFVARRSSNLYGLVAALLLVASGASRYATEARPYGLVLGFSALALLAWQLAMKGGPHRTAGLVALWLSLAAAVACHYYAVLLLVPFGAALLVHAAANRRIDWAAAVALTGGLAPVVVFLPLIRSALGYAGTFWAVPKWPQSIQFYREAASLALGRSSVILLAAVGAVSVCAVVFWMLRQRMEPAWPASSCPGHEVALIVTLALLPFVAIVVAKLVTGAYVARYVISAIIALAAFGAVLLHRIDRWLVVGGTALTFGLAAAIGYVAVDDVGDAGTLRDDRAATIAFIQSASRGSPVVIASAHEFFELSHDADERGGPALVYLADPDAALRVLGTDTIELGLLQLQHFAPLQLIDYESYTTTHDDFLLFGEQLDWDWVTEQLRADGYRFAVKAQLGDDRLYEVARE